MATLTITPARPKVGDTLVITGTGFTPATDVSLSVGEAGLTMFIKSGPSGDLKTDKAFLWTPTRVGIFSVRANDGVNRVDMSLQVWS